MNAFALSNPVKLFSAIAVTALVLLGGFFVSVAQADASTPLTLSGCSITADTKAYDGTSDATVTPNCATPSIVEDVSGFDVQLAGTLSSSGTFDNKNVGTGKTVTATGLTLTGADAGDFVIVFPTATANITALPITVTASTNTKTYDADQTAAATPVVSVNSIVAGDTANFIETYDTKNVGTGKTLTPSGTVDDGNGGNNYVVTFVDDTTGAITEKTLTASATIPSKVFDGNDSATAVMGSDKFGSDSVNLGYTSATYADKNVGTAKAVTVSGISITGGTDAGNYILGNTSVSTTGNITTFTVGVTAQNQSKEFGASDPTLLSPNKDTLFSGDIYTGAVVRASGESLGNYAITQGTFAIDDGNSGLNYHIAFSAGTFSIVDTTAPVITNAIDQTFEATGALTTPTLVVPTATDAADPSPTITPGATSFSVGTTNLTWTATDASSNSSNTIVHIVITDTTGPTIVGTPATTTAEATSHAGAVVTYTAPTATDLVDGSVAVSCLPASGSTFVLGTTPVTCTATDAHSNSSTSTFNVVVQDTTAPVVSIVSPLDGLDVPGTVALTLSATDNTNTTLLCTLDTTTTSCTASSLTLNHGIHVLVVTATDEGLNSTTATSTFNFRTPVVSGGGGGGGGGGGFIAPTPAPSSGGSNGQVLGAEIYNFTVNLRIGMRGNDVTELQKVLIEQGYLMVDGGPTGYFGVLTFAAVKKYQAAHNVSPTSGFVGPLTRAELNKGN